MNNDVMTPPFCFGISWLSIDAKLIMINNIILLKL